MPSQSRAEVTWTPDLCFRRHHKSRCDWLHVVPALRVPLATGSNHRAPRNTPLNPSWYLSVHIIQGPVWRQKLYQGFGFGVSYVDIFITENLIKLVLPVNLIANFIESKKRTLSSHVGRNLSLLGLQKWREEAGISSTSKLREGSLPRWNGSVSRKDYPAGTVNSELRGGIPVGLGLSSPGSEYQHLRRHNVADCDTAGNAACESQGCYKKELPLPGRRSMTGAMPPATKYLSAPLLPHTGRAF